MHQQQTGQSFLPARVPAIASTRHPARIQTRRRSPVAPMELLESRTLYAAASPVQLAKEALVNATQLRENQHSGSIAVDRTDPGRIVYAAVSDSRITGPLDDTDLDDNHEPDQLPPFNPPLLGEVLADHGVFTGVSSDGGRNFSVAPLATGLVSPSLAFDDFGNLFLTYYNRKVITIGDPDDPLGSAAQTDISTVDVLLSTDRGVTFGSVPIASFPAAGLVNPFANTAPDAIDVNTVQPTVVTGAGMVWVCFEDPETTQIVASGARVVGLGENSVDEFLPLQAAFRSEKAKFADIAIGPSGQVMVTYEILKFDPDAHLDLNSGAIVQDVDGTITVTGEQDGPAEVFVNIDPDGLGHDTFGRRYKVTDTNVGLFDPINANSTNAIDAAPGIVYDRSGGPFNGRAWMVYTDTPRNGSGDESDIFLRFSDDDGRTWSSPRTVQDDAYSRGTRFLPHIALDQTTGNIAVTFYGTRNENGLSVGDNDEVRYFATVGVPTITEAGVSFSRNLELSDGWSDAARARNVLDFGEYEGLDYHDNIVYPIWADNSNTTLNNPSGGVGSGTNLATFDLYTTRVFVTAADPTPPERAPVGPGSPLTPQFIGKDTITKGKFYKFQVRYQSTAGINVASLGDDDILVTGPDGYNLFADFTKAKRARHGTLVTATYLAPAPGGMFDLGDNGQYSVLLQGGAVSDITGTLSAPGLLDQFLVSSSLLPQSPPVLPAAPVSAAVQATDNDDDLVRAVGL